MTASLAVDYYKKHLLLRDTLEEAFVFKRLEKARIHEDAGSALSAAGCVRPTSATNVFMPSKCGKAPREAQSSDKHTCCALTLIAQ
jgi:hypothetical protein